MTRERDGKSRRAALRWAALVVVPAGLLGWWFAPARGARAGSAAGEGESGRRRGDRAVSVQVASAKTADVRVVLTGLGTVVPRQSATVRSRVSGQLVRVSFEEGALVKAGDLLAEVDARQLAAQAAQAEGQLGRDRAVLANAELDLGRLQALKAGVVAAQEVDTQSALVRQHRGTVRAGEGALQSARLMVSYARITAPIDGRIGLRQVDVGNYVSANDATGIAVINAVKAIGVVFSLPERHLPAVRARLEEGARAGSPLVVEAWDRESRARLATGTLVTVDNQIDPATGTIKLKARFPNEDGSLYPNQFVNVRLLLDTLRGATVAPVVAVQRGTPGTFVYVVGADETVSVRPVELGPVDGDLVAIGRGLAAGEAVVTNGVDKLREGARVQVAKAAPKTASKQGRAAATRLAERGASE